LKNISNSNSDKEAKFISNVINLVKSLNTNHINSVKDLESTIQEFIGHTDEIWFKHSKIVNITRHSKSWWSSICQRHLELYRNSKQLEDWKNFEKMVKITKREFFNEKIQEISNRKNSSWNLMNWVKKHKLPAIEAIKYNSRPCLKIKDL